MRYPSLPAIPGLPPVVINPIAKPGMYQVRLTVDGASQTEAFGLSINPNESYSRAETDARAEHWMRLYALAEKGVNTVNRAIELRDNAQAVLDSASASADEKRAAENTITVCSDFIDSAITTGRTLVQIISEPTKPMAKLVLLHNLLEHSEGPPNQPWLDVWEKTSTEIEQSIAKFEKAVAM